MNKNRCKYRNLNTNASAIVLFKVKLKILREDWNKIDCLHPLSKCSSVDTNDFNKFGLWSKSLSFSETWFVARSCRFTTSSQFIFRFNVKSFNFLTWINCGSDSPLWCASSWEVRNEMSSKIFYWVSPAWRLSLDQLLCWFFHRTKSDKNRCTIEVPPALPTSFCNDQIWCFHFRRQTRRLLSQDLEHGALFPGPRDYTKF